MKRSILIGLCLTIVAGGMGAQALSVSNGE